MYTIRELWTAARRDRGGRFAIGVTVALVGAQVTVMIVGGAAAARAAHESTADMFQFAAAVSVERASTVARSAHGLTREAGELFAGGLPDQETIRVALVRELGAHPTLGAVSITLPDGTYYNVQLTANGNFTTQTRTMGLEHTSTWEWIGYDHAATRLVGWKPTPIIDPLELPAYIAGITALVPVWTYPELDPSTGATQVWLADPIRNSRGGLVAVVGAGVRLDALSAAVNDLPGSTAQAYLLASNRAILAAPDSAAKAISEVQAATGDVATDLSVGLHPSTVVTSWVGESVVGRDGDMVTLETALPADTAPWVVHVQATLATLSPAAAELRRTLLTMALLMGVALLAAVAVLMRTLRPLSRLRANAELDRLTGLSNRHYFDRQSNKVVARSVADSMVIAVAMVDLDNFKGLNDLRGHAEGDQALAMVGQVLRAEMRDTDMAVRWGGDEFLLVFALAPGADAYTVVERVRAHVSVALEIKFGAGVRVGATAGFAVLDSNREALQAVVTRADWALLAGKRVRKGRTYDISVLAQSAEPKGKAAPAVRGA